MGTQDGVGIAGTKDKEAVPPAVAHTWVAGFAHWGQSHIYNLCSREEWDGRMTINGQHVIEVAGYMDPGVAERIVALHNREVGGR